MKKQQLSAALLVAMMCLGMLTGCGHEHHWTEADCTTPKTCPDCGETEGAALGHEWAAATCTAPRTCTVCGETEGGALGHKWAAATCTEPETCTVCGETQGKALGHAVELWTLTEEASCSREGKETGGCSRCGEDIERPVAMIAHTPGEWVVVEMPTETAEGTRVRNCTVCGAEVEKEYFSLSAEELELLYKDSCQSITYDSLARRPGDYAGERVVFKGKVVQVCSEAPSALYYSTYRVATSGGYDDVVYIYVDNYGSGERILEDDWITFYGEYDGLFSYTTVLGATLTIPSVKVQYID